ncbi:MAG: hypothetical protein IPK82_17245 [Polyangiaceae bacterium]|nr:hypothetical protein [Polyangiaceae bacterium]
MSALATDQISAHSLRSIVAFFAALILTCACTPAASPEAEELPCRTDEDCELHGRDSGPRAALCSNRALNFQSAKDIAACGPLPNMSVSPSEPTLLCFRGSCVPVKTK